jgi:hypothetical protein
MSTDYQPNKRHSHRTHIIKDKLYMWAGEQPNHPPGHDDQTKKMLTSRVEVFTLSTGKWEQLQTKGNPPLAISQYSSAVIGSDIFYFGGSCDHGPFGDGCYHNSFFKLNVDNSEWNEVLPTGDYDGGPAKKSRCGMVAVKVHGSVRLLVIGGRGDDGNIEIHYYELSSGEWMAITSSMGQQPPPSCTGFTLSTVAKDRFIMFGGSNSDGWYNDVYIGHCEPSIITWVKISQGVDSSMKWPKGRSGHAAAMIDEHHLLVIGGSERLIFYTKDCWIFNINESTWKEFVLPLTVTNRQNHSLSVWSINPSTVWVIVFGGEKQPESVHYSNTSVIELRCNDEGDWSIGEVMIHPLTEYTEKLQKYKS